MSSNRCGLRMDRSTSCGRIGAVAISQEDAPVAWYRKKFPVSKPNKTDAKPSRDRPFKEQEQVVRRPRPVEPFRDQATGALKPEKLELRQSQAPGKSIFFIGTLPEEEGLENDVRAVGFGDLVKICTVCEKGFDIKKDVHMYRGRPFCSFECRDRRIGSDGLTRMQVGLKDNESRTTKLSKRKGNVRLGQAREV